ncbi:MAG: hypothetical protein NXI31_09265 [bacterium]|nr:hypothetical protein [bacterium]
MRPCLPVLTAATGLALLLPAQGPARSAPSGAPSPEFTPTLDSIHYLMTRTPGGDAESPVETVAAASWMMLAYGATGSSLRVGRYKAPLRHATRWLRAQQANDGWFAPVGQPCTRFEQLIAAFAMAETCAISQYKLLKSTSRKAVSAALAAFESEDSDPATAEEIAMLVMLADVIAIVEGDAKLAKRCRILGKAARRNITVGRDRRSDSALHLTAMLLGEEFPAALTVARAWPTNPARDPFHTWLGLQALRRTDGRTCHRELQALQRLAASQRTKGAEKGSWPAAAGLDEVVTTGVLATVSHSAFLLTIDK